MALAYVDTRVGSIACGLSYLAHQRIRVLALTDGAGLYRILMPVLDIVGKRDPGMPALLVDRDRWGWKVRVREGPDRDGDLLFMPFLDEEDS